MNEERRRRVEALAEQALARGPAERDSFLSESCQGDFELKQEVEALLAKEETALPADKAMGNDPAQAPTATFFQPGRLFGPYEIEKLLGTGGSALVYRASDPRLGRQVALKVLAAGTVDRGFRQRFVQEARSAAALNHPNIAVIYEVGETEGYCFIAMEYIEGETLRRRTRAPESTLLELLGYLRQTAKALQKAHSHGIVHCDLKPENIMVTQDGFAKVLDFGLARLLAQSKGWGPEGNEPARLRMPPGDRSGRVEGTPGYMSPEQAEGKRDIDERSDVFSFGCMLFEVAARKLAFTGVSVGRTLRILALQPAARLGEYCPSAPPGLQRIVDRCLQRDPGLRYANIEEVEHELGALLQEMEGGTGKPPRAGATRRAVVAVGAAVVLMLAMAYWIGTQPKPRPSVAVIPFANAQGTAESEYLSEGISEGLINALAQVSDLKVIARTSSFRFRGDKVDLRQAAKALGVQALVTGRVAEMNGRLRITVELVQGEDGTQIWGAHYSPSGGDLANLQAAITGEIAERIRSKLTTTERARLAKGAKVKPEANELLLRARYHFRLYTPESREKAASYYQQAIAIDPGFALAHAELASLYRMQSGSAIASAAEMIPKAEAAVGRALAADAELAEAHAALADIRKDQWDWAAAEREYRRAIELNPNLSAAHQGLAIYLSVMGKSEAAAEEMQRALERDPLGLPTIIHAAAVHYNARQYDKALAALNRALELDPSSSSAWSWLGIVRGGTGQYEAALKAYEKGVKLGDDTAATQCYYAFSLARAGRREEAQRILDRVEGTHSYVPPSTLAVIHLGLNRKDEAIRALQSAYSAKDPLLQYITVESHFDELAGDPRFQNIVKRIGLPQ